MRHGLKDSEYLVYMFSASAECREKTCIALYFIFDGFVSGKAGRFDEMRPHEEHPCHMETADRWELWLWYGGMSLYVHYPPSKFYFTCGGCYWYNS